jgi:hypothetical protein
MSTLIFAAGAALRSRRKRDLSQLFGLCGRW